MTDAQQAMNHQKVQIYRQAVEQLLSLDIPARVYEHYSGRGMGGAETPGIVTSAPAWTVGWAITVAAAEVVGDDDVTAVYDCILHDAIKVMPTSFDDLGHEQVYY